MSGSTPSTRPPPPIPGRGIHHNTKQGQQSPNWTNESSRWSQEVEKFKNECRQKDQQIQQLQQQLNEKDQQLQQLQQQLYGKEQQLHEKDQQLYEKEQLLYDKDQQLVYQAQETQQKTQEALYWKNESNRLSQETSHLKTKFDQMEKEMLNVKQSLKQPQQQQQQPPSMFPPQQVISQFPQQNQGFSSPQPIPHGGGSGGSNWSSGGGGGLPNISSMSISKDDDTSGYAHRVTDALQENPSEFLSPITDLKSIPIMSIDAALQPLESQVPNLKRFIWMAKFAANKDLKNAATTFTTTSTTVDALAAIRIYTMEFKPSERSVYALLNQSLRTADRKKLKPFEPYLRLLLFALEQLPSLGSKTTLFRGIKGNLPGKYEEGEQIIWWGFSSCTLSLGALKNPQFLGKDGRRTVFSIETDRAKSIAKFSAYSSEEEVLLLPGQLFTVKSKLDAGNGLEMIQLVAEELPFPLIE